MEERKDHIRRLVRGWMEDTITPEEKEELVSLLDEQNLLPDVDTGLQEVWEAQTSQPVFSEAETVSMIERILSNNRIEEEDESRPPVHRIHFMRRWGWVAASVILLLSAGVYLWTKDPAAQPAIVQTPTNEVMPATGKVVLKLPGGKQIYLDSTQGNIVQEGALVVNNEKGSLAYNGAAGKMEYHTLATPGGRQYKLQLPDGTNAWLNAASSITYPIAFTGPDRQVIVSGEVYFEVAKDKSKPFRVAAQDMLITVTGTHFNVQTYNDEPFFTTTVLEGGVQVSRYNRTVTLSANQQSLSDSTGTISVQRNVNVRETVAWREGLFHFESADLPTILHELARWYDLDVRYEGTISKERFFVIVNRNSSLSAVLKALQTDDVEFRIDGRKLTVQSRK